MSYSIIDTRGLQNFDKSVKLNTIEIKRDGNQILKPLKRYQKGPSVSLYIKWSPVQLSHYK